MTDAERAVIDAAVIWFDNDGPGGTRSDWETHEALCDAIAAYKASISAVRGPTGLMVGIWPSTAGEATHSYD